MSNSEIFNLRASSLGCFGAGYSYEIVNWTGCHTVPKYFNGFFWSLTVTKCDMSSFKVNLDVPSSWQSRFLHLRVTPSSGKKRRLDLMESDNILDSGDR